MPVFWLTEVKPKESIELLATFVDDTDEKAKASRKRSESSIAAIALHADPAADRAMEKFVDANRPILAPWRSSRKC